MQKGLEYLISINEKTQGKKKHVQWSEYRCLLFFFLKDTKKKIKIKIKRGSK
jgi:hypothetical protein